ncbi:MAG TPA: hypothetical protein VGR13_03735, partial [Actinomycetota bacterium]|nr:hypothetical protein [Actinomycetota bacterium]
MKIVGSQARRWWAGLLVLGLVAGTLLTVSGGAGAAERPEPDGKLRSRTARAGRPTQSTPNWSPRGAPASRNHLNRAKAFMNRVEVAESKLRTPRAADATVVGATPGTQSEPIGTNAFTDFQVMRNTAPSPPNGYASSIGEPSVGQAGKFVFYTHNWYAHRSTDGGQTWTGIDPFVGFPDFCCDQEAIYSTGRNVLIWERMGLVPVGGTENVIKLGASTNGGASFCNFDITPGQIGESNAWHDYPHLAVTNRYLWMTTNLFDLTDTWIKSVIMRFPLSVLSTCGSLNYSTWSTNAVFTITPAQGALYTQFFVSHLDTNTERIFYIYQGSGSLLFTDTDVPAWTATPRGSAHCPILGGSNPCARTDDRVSSVFVRRLNGQYWQLWEFWNVAEGGGFPLPYVNAATFGTSLNYIARPNLWSAGTAYAYASGVESERGDVGLNVTSFTSSTYPSQVVGLDDDFNASPPSWEIYTVNTSTGDAGG